MESDALSLLGLVKRSGGLAVGSKVLETVRNGKAEFVVIAGDASERTRKVLSDKCTFYQVPFGFVEHMEALSRAVGKSHIAAVAVTDNGFAKKISDFLK